MTASPRDPFRRFVEACIGDGWMPGATWWVEARGHVVSRGAAGSAVLGLESEAVRDGTPFDAASLTKPLATAPLLAILEREGRVAAGDAVGQWIVEARGTPLADVSLLELARHEAGLPAWQPLYLDARDPSDYLERIARAARAEERGNTVYSDLGYIVLGYVIERASGAALDRLFNDRIASPLGLERSGFSGPMRSYSDAAATEHGNVYERTLAGGAGAKHAWRDAIPRGEVHDGNAYALGGTAGHAGLFLTASDTATIGRELLAPGRLDLGESGRARLLFATRPGARAAGFVPARESRAARRVLSPESPGHTGFTGTSVWLDPATQGVFVLLTNRVHPAVSSRGFHWLRRAFHRLARRAAASV